MLRRHLLDFTFDPVLQFRFGDFQIVAHLQVQPGLRIRAEVARQPQCGIGCDRAAFLDDLVQARGGYAQCL